MSRSASSTAAALPDFPDAITHASGTVRHPFRHS
jgi:hypothetical protein